MDICTNVTYNMLSGQTRRLYKSVHDSKVHSKMVKNFAGEWINKIRRKEIFNVESASLPSFTTKLSVLKEKQYPIPAVIYYSRYLNKIDLNRLLKYIIREVCWSIKRKDN